MPLTIKSRSCGTTDCDAQDYKGSHLAVYHQGEDCTRRLRRNRAITGPSIPVQLTENNVELRDGSEAYPLRFPALQKHNTEAIPALVGILPDGTLVAWNFGYFSGRKKFVLENGTMKLVGDYLSDLFDQPVCEADCGEVAGALGYKVITQNCIGEPTKEVYQVCRIPSCCCEDAPAESCDDCAAIDALLVEGGGGGGG